ncbi:MAG: N-acetylglucosamine-specific PTS transporter subunit IIBC [Mycoplasmatales bacterium]
MMNYLRNIGKSLLMPIAVLPAAAILAGIGNWLISIGFLPLLANILLMAGTSILDNLAILFAIGLAFGLSKDKNGAAALPAVVMWFVVFRLLSTDSLVTLLGLDPDSAATTLDVLGKQIGDVQAASFTKLNNAFIGIMIGVISAELYNRLHTIELNKALSFFSGRRLVPIVAAFVGILLAFILYFIWPIVYTGLVSFGEIIVSMGSIGAGIYGFLNRLLIPTGLHNALNSVFWFDVAGISDINNYLGCTANNFDVATGICTISSGAEAIKGQTGMYQAGFFPIMMFGLPAASYAIYKNALPENKVKVGSIMLAGAFASFFTGVTEPLEFSFMFVAWPLYVLHAILTGISLFIAAQFHFINGFGFSGGFVDFILNYKNPLATAPYMLVVQGLVFAAIYYFTFDFAIKKFNLLTPGRTKGEFDEAEEEYASSSEKYQVLAQKIYDIVGKDNLKEVDNCATRLRLTVENSEEIDADKIKKLAVAGVVKPSKDQIQVIVGPTVEFVANELKKLSGK